MKLAYTTDSMPGYRRIRRGKGFSYISPDGQYLTDPLERKRILSLAIPPAYENVWICILKNGHLQATGVDARRRKQYRYHPEWHELAADRKFELLIDFASTLPRIRAALRRELARPELTRERVIAGIVALLDLTGYRIGNARYARENRTYGLATLLMRHLKEDRGRYRLKFRGKSGHAYQVKIADPRLARLIAKLQELPGQHLFCYEDEAGNVNDIETGDVNDWLKHVSGGDYTAKQFRTWKATVLCAGELAGAPPSDTKSGQEQAIRDAIKATAAQLNHTPTVCRKYYIHPNLIESYRSGELFEVMNSPPPQLSRRTGTASLRADERRVLKILSRQVAGVKDPIVSGMPVSGSEV
jgi:DNA topoisomerase I